MSINPKVMPLNRRKILKLHMRVENPFDYTLKGSINFVINLPKNKKRNILKKITIHKKEKKDFFIDYKLDSSFKAGFYKVSAFFYYNNKKSYSLNKDNDFFCIIDTEKGFNEKNIFRRIKNPIVLREFKKSLKNFLNKTRYNKN
jgi:hypothetical protein